jgi:hypothetical protein
MILKQTAVFCLGAILSLSPWNLVGLLANFWIRDLPNKNAESNHIITME